MTSLCSYDRMSRPDDLVIKNLNYHQKLNLCKKNEIFLWKKTNFNFNFRKKDLKIHSWPWYLPANAAFAASAAKTFIFSIQHFQLLAIVTSCA